MGLFTASENDFDFDFLPVFEKFFGFFESGLEVLFSDANTQTNTLDFNLPRMGLFGAFFFFFLVFELTEVHDAADRGLCLGGDLHKVQLPFYGKVKRFADRHNSEIGALIVDHADARYANVIIRAVLKTSVLLRSSISFVMNSHLEKRRSEIRDRKSEFEEILISDL